MKASSVLESMQAALAHAPANLQAELLAALSKSNGHFQEARQGRIVRVADLKYLKESRGMESMGMRLSEGVAQVAEDMEETFLNEGFQGWDELADFAADHFVEMGEATSASAFGQLLRAGVQTIANDYYLRTPISWTTYVREYASDKRQEFHAPLHRSSLPMLTRPQQPYKESGIVGEDIELVNKKFMGGESFERELWEDDQTGQIRQRAQSLGEAQRVLEEIYVAGRILGLTGFTQGNFVVPTSQYKTRNAKGTVITTPYSANLYTTGSGNLLSTNKVLGGSSLKEGIARLMNALDPKDLKIMVRPNHIVASVQDALNARILTESQLNATVQGVGGTTFNNQVGGTIGSMNAINAFNGLLTFSINYYFPDWAWIVGEKQKGPVFQRRTPMEVVQEVPNSGQSFDLDSIRWRTRSRWEMDWIDSRFWLRGNDGTAVGQQ